jgi:two-component system aerobic respiration control sensor histidine kinase ArcB
MKKKSANKNENLAIALDDILKNLPGHVYWKDKNGAYLGCNDLQAIDLGFSNGQEIIGKTDADIPQYKRIAADLRKNDVKCMTTGKSIVAEEWGIVDGKEAVMLSQKIPLRDDDGNIVGVLGISQNISKLKENEKRLKKSNVAIALDNILKNLPGHIFWKDKNGAYLGCNDLQAIDFGFLNRQEVVGKTDANIPLHRKIAADLRKNDVACMTTGKQIIAEEWGIVDGKNVLMLSQKVPLKDSDENIIGVLGIAQDISKLKEYEARLKELTESKLNFMRMMSHEVNSPISNIVNALNVLKKYLAKNGEIKEKKCSDFWNMAYAEAHSAMKKVKDMVSYLTFDADSFFKNTSNVDVNEVVSKIFSKHKSEGKNSVKFVVSTADNFPDAVMLDSAVLYKILDTVIENAAKYTNQGEIKISLALKKDKQSKNHFLLITISDTGIGIYKKELDFILKSCKKGYVSNEEPDIYAKVSVKIPYAYLLTTQILGGSFEISSVVNKGTLIKLRIPCLLKETTKSKVPASLFKGLHVLLVEDNENSRHLESALLSSLGLVVDAVSTATEAISHCQKNPYDIIFLDITLPDMSGVEAIPYLTATTHNKNTVVVAMTSHSSDDDIDHFNSVGMASVITKPVQIEQVTLFLETYVQNIQKQNED